MERRDRAPVATFVVEGPFAPNAVVALGGEAVHHARVKRLEPADCVRLTNGAGLRAIGVITTLSRNELSVAVETVDAVPRLAPIHLCAPVADRDRMLWLAEKSAELAVTSWQSVRFQRSMSVSPRGEGAAFSDKLGARIRGAVEQSGGAWLPVVLPDVPVESLTIAEGRLGILLDVEGEPIADVVARVNGREPVVLVGPEGGLEPSERETLIQRGWSPARLATSTLRFETAGIAAVAVLRASRP